MYVTFGERGCISADREYRWKFRYVGMSVAKSIILVASATNFIDADRETPSNVVKKKCPKPPVRNTSRQETAATTSNLGLVTLIDVPRWCNRPESFRVLFSVKDASGLDRVKLGKE
jgi:hypothetical protein